MLPTYPPLAGKPTEEVQKMHDDLQRKLVTAGRLGNGNLYTQVQQLLAYYAAELQARQTAQLHELAAAHSEGGTLEDLIRVDKQ